MARLVQMNFKERDVRLKDIPKFYKELSSKKLTVGVHHEQGKHNVEKAVWNEFGTIHITQHDYHFKSYGYDVFIPKGKDISIPARPFVRLYFYPDRFDRMKRAFSDKLSESFRVGLRNYKSKANEVWDIMGYTGRFEMRDIILSNTVLLPNAPLTVAIKGFDYPLVKEGKMVNAIDYKIGKR